MMAKSSTGMRRAAHAAAVAGLFLIQGCQTTKPEHDTVKVEQTKPVMPPTPLKPVTPALTPSMEPQLNPPPVDAAATSYVVQKGDTLSGIAKRSGVSSRQLIEQNKLKNANQIRVGQTLNLPAGHGIVAPASSHSASHHSAAKPSAAKPAPRPGAEKYVVRKGDSISRIAARYGTTAKALRETNKLKGDNIMIGQVLHLPEGAALKKAGPETTPSASAKHGTESAAPKPVAAASKATPTKPAAVVTQGKANPAAFGPSSTHSNVAAKASAPAIPAAARVEPAGGGATPPPSAGAAATASAAKAAADGGEYLTHTVAAGEDVFDVALKYTVLPDEVRRLNNLTGNELKEGDKLKIKVAGPAH